MAEPDGRWRAALLREVDAPPLPGAPQPGPDQTKWEAQLAASGLTPDDERLRSHHYIRREFPPINEVEPDPFVAVPKRREVPLPELKEDDYELEVWDNDQPRTMRQIREAIEADGLLPADPRQAPRFAREQHDDTWVWIPELSDSYDANGGREVVALIRRGEERLLVLNHRDPFETFGPEERFLVLRTKSLGA